MANRDFKWVRALERVVTELDFDISIGSSGAPTLTTPAAGLNSYNLGLASISRTSAGIYLLTLQDNYQRLLNFQVVQIGTLQELDFGVTTDYANGTPPAGGTLSFTCSVSGVATDPTNGTSLRIYLRFKNSSVS